MTACETLTQAIGDPDHKCGHPEKPEKPYTDESAGLIITAQGQAIDKCMALLGYKLGPLPESVYGPPRPVLNFGV